jgi:cytochrome o ubiquinol oxidase subunit IV
MSHSHHVEPDYGTGKKTLSIYIIGLVLCVVLTLIPFLVVYAYKLPVNSTSWISHLFSGREQWSETFITWVIAISAFLQFIVQVASFLRLNTGTQQGRVNIYSFIFAIIILVVLVGGTMWIMYTLHGRMMSGAMMRHAMQIVPK